MMSESEQYGLRFTVYGLRSRFFSALAETVNRKPETVIPSPHRENDPS